MKTRLLFTLVVALFLTTLQTGCSSSPTYTREEAALMALALMAQQAQKEAAEFVAKQLMPIAARAHADGFELDKNLTVSGSMRENASENHIYHFQAGHTYLIAGACDQDCHDLDLILFDQNGNAVDKDQKKDSLPIVGGKAHRSGNFLLKVQMHSCSVSPCAYGIICMKR